MMRIALEVWSASFTQLESTGVFAESLGIDALYYGESPHDLNLDCWTALAGLARSTERIRLGPIITNVLPTYRSHVLLAKQAATVDAIADGRVDFRTGTGGSAAFARPWWEPFGVEYPDYEERLEDLTLAIEALRGLWRRQPPAMAHPIDLPITIAATGERALRLAAEHADVWETSFCSPDEFGRRNEHFGELATGRRVTRSLEIDGFVSTTPDGLDALLERVRSERAAEDLGAVFERALVGGPTQAAERLAELRAAGVEQVVIALHDPHDHDALEAVAGAAALIDR